jgi:hypothetical protein
MSAIDGAMDLISVTTRQAFLAPRDVEAPWLLEDEVPRRGSGGTQRLSRPAWSSGARPRAPERFVPAVATPLETEPCVFGLPHDLAVRFRTLCASRGVEQARVLERLVKSYVILGLADPSGGAA